MRGQGEDGRGAAGPVPGADPGGLTAILLGVRGHCRYVAGKLARGRPEDAEDLASVGVLAVVLAYRRGRFDRDPNPPQLACVAAGRAIRRAAAKRERERAREQQLPTLADGSTADVPDTRPADAEAWGYEHLVGLADPADRPLLDLRFRRGLTIAQLAQSLDVPPDAARRMLARALDRLRGRVNPFNDPGA